MKSGKMIGSRRRGAAPNPRPTRSVPDWKRVAPKVRFWLKYFILSPVRLRTRARRIIIAPVGRFDLSYYCLLPTAYCLHDSIHSIPAESSPDVVRRQRAVAAVEGERNSVSGLD